MSDYIQSCLFVCCGCRLFSAVVGGVGDIICFLFHLMCQPRHGQYKENAIKDLYLYLYQGLINCGVCSLRIFWLRERKGHFCDKKYRISMCRDKTASSFDFNITLFNAPLQFMLAYNNN